MLIMGEEKKIITGIKNTMDFHESLGGKSHFLIVRTKLAALGVFLQKPSQNLNIHLYLSSPGSYFK